MAIIRSALSFEAHYTQVPNAFARDGRISLRARGLLLAIMSHRTEWRLTVESLVRDNPEGRDAIRTAIGELREAGYLVVRARQDEHGKFDGQDYALRDPFDPANAELLETRRTENPPSGDPDTKNTIAREHHVEEHQEQDQSGQVTFQNAGVGGTDDDSYAQGSPQFVDMQVIAGHIEAQCGRTVSQQVLMAIVGTILERAKVYPSKPTRYVQAAITGDPFGWQKYVDGGKAPR